MKKLIVIGCGAAGMMAAIAAAESGCSVTLLEKNEKPGKKIYITGKGRCNVTNACDVNDYFGNVIRNSKFLYSSVYGYDNTAVMDFFEENGCHLKTERGDRVFPVSDHSSDIINTLVRKLKSLNVVIEYNSEVQELIFEQSPDSDKQKVSGVKLKKGKKLDADAVIVATGGRSYPSTGSTGDGYGFAKSAGHTVTEIRPSLVPFEVSEGWCLELQGLSLKNVSLKMENIPFVDDRKASEEPEKKKSKKKKAKILYDGFGEMLFTHFGVSGPLVLTASCYYEEAGTTILHLDLKPALDKETLDKRILREFEGQQNKQFKNAIAGLFPAKMIPVMVQLSGIDPEKTVNDVTKQERLGFVELIKDLKMTVTGTRSFNEAIITRGGVKTSEIDPSTMQSKLVDGLYFAGEVIDTDAVTGGFNLQIAWSTGHLAGISVAE